MCSGRVDLKFVFRAFLRGMDGVFIGGCHLGECNYITHGNYDALNMVLVCRRILQQIGLNPERLRIEFMSGGEGHRFAEVVQDFGAAVTELGPLGKSEGLDPKVLQHGLEAVDRLVPYLKMVAGQRLKAGIRSEAAYRQFHESDTAAGMYRELIGNKLAIAQILQLLERRPQSTGDIARELGMSPSQVSGYMKDSSRQGLIRYDVQSNQYSRAVMD